MEKHEEDVDHIGFDDMVDIACSVHEKQPGGDRTRWFAVGHDKGSDAASNDQVARELQL